jgi:tetratricopeptide (TPR) repeat protein
MLRPGPALALLAVLPSASATAAVRDKEWYVHYADAERALRQGNCARVVASLREATRERPKSASPAQTYGVNFIDYFPYYLEGQCRLRQREYSLAVTLFNVEESHEAIKGVSAAYRDLQARRAEAQRRLAQETQETRTRRAQADVQRLRREAEEAARAGKLDEALARLGDAQKLAEQFDPEAHAQVVERLRRLEREKADREEQARRVERTETALADGRRLLQAGRAPEALVRFDEVLALDPVHAAAREGRSQAEERIRAETTRQEREAAYRDGLGLFDAGRFEEALGRLAGADPDQPEHRSMLERAQAKVESLRRQRDLSRRVGGLLVEAEGLISSQRFSEAVVKLRALLELDPTHPRAEERARFADSMASEAIFERIYPNGPPSLALAQPPAEVRTESLTLWGAATDDRGLARLEYRRGGELLAEAPLVPDRESGRLPRSARVEHRFALLQGPNQISVTAVDGRGLTASDTFTVLRRLPFHQTRAFWPSAVAGALGLVGLGLTVQRVRQRRALRSRFNPYIAGAPVLDPEMFYGREKILARILNVLHHNSLMVTGERRIGKTTFLYQLKQALEKDEGPEYRFFPVFVDLQGLSEADFFHGVMAEVVEGLKLSPAAQADLRFRREQARYDGRDFSHDLQRAIDELKTRTERKVKLVLLIDEVDVLNEFSERVNQRLRSIFMKTFSEHLVAIMSGVGIRRVWNSEGSPWYNFFDQIELGALSREAAEALVREPVEGIFRFEPEAVEMILEESGCKPYLIQKLCVHAVNRMIEDGRTRITRGDVAGVREAVQDEARGEALARRASA